MSSKPFFNTAWTIPLMECHTCGKKYNFSHSVWECQEYRKLTYLLHMNKKANTPMKIPLKAAEPAREEECLLGYDQEGDKTIALYGKRNEDGYVEVTKRVEGLWVGPTENSKPYVPKVGDRILIEATVDHVDRSCVNPLWAIRVADSLCVFVDSEDLANAKLVPPRTITKAEAEALLTEKLGESVRIE